MAVIWTFVRRAVDDAVAVTGVGLAVLVVGATAVVAATVPDSGPVPGATGAPVPSWSGVAPVTAAQAPDGGVLRVVEQGFTLDPDPRVDHVTYGLLLENTSRERIAYAVAVTVRAVDAAGGTVRQRFGREDVARHTVYAVFPGQRFGIGVEEWLDGRGVAALTVTVEPPTWVPVDQPLQRDPGRLRVIRLGPLAAGEVRAIAGSRFSVSFNASSGFEERIPVGVAVLWRDGAGRIVGGAAATDATRCLDVAPGQGRFSVEPDRIRSVPAGADVARTEVFLAPFGVNQPNGCLR
ncbi:hypothetical protein [Virgisporangium ochraceum]|uniref:Uncharacterized protein n=1 Tax=Virgisporangium ochraceum TaxID=65505 RepID=A0A8J3ZQU4_9ACTN|nr:hypothetical protein [Virgisporangium ochraceum]GIJ66615.1 hypothetical protein Voc01_015320 [Virgisporangium ochraceum]